jgi:hypothetical protein
MWTSHFRNTKSDAVEKRILWIGKVNMKTFKINTSLAV